MRCAWRRRRAGPAEGAGGGAHSPAHREGGGGEVCTGLVIPVRILTTWVSSRPQGCVIRTILILSITFNACSPGPQRTATILNILTLNVRTHMMVAAASVQVVAELNRARTELETEGRATQLGKLCATPFGVDIVGITEFVALIGALVGGAPAAMSLRRLVTLLPYVSVDRARPQSHRCSPHTYHSAAMRGRLCMDRTCDAVPGARSAHSDKPTIGRSGGQFRDL